MRPELEIGLDADTFLNYYYLKEELVDFCRENGLPVSGGKLELTQQIESFLRTGEVKKVTSPRRTSQADVGILSEDSIIEENFVCSEKHRAFFKDRIGKSFSFNVDFQKWLKQNSGKTYRDAIAAYGQIMQERKNKKTTIDRQFEYNTYIRDFFADNPGKSLEDAIACWKYKKSIPGHNRYERTDFVAVSDKIKKERG